MDDQEYEIHPLDRDYSTPVKSAKRKPTSIDSKLHRIGLFTFAAGFITVFLAAIVLGTFRGSGWIETVGSYLHRLAMLLILIGGIVIIAAYRVPQLKGKIRMPSGKIVRINSGSFFLLFVANLIGFVVISLLGSSLRFFNSSQAYFLAINATLTITCALMVTLIVWHRGLLRAFAIGVLVALVLNFFSSLVGFSGRYGYWRADATVVLMAHLATIQISGLVCAGYVALLDSYGRQNTEAAESEAP